MLLAAAGELYVNGVQSTEANHRQAYVEQSDNFYSMLSVAETLTMAAQLQMAPGLPESSKQSYVDNLISVLGLAKVGAAGWGSGWWMVQGFGFRVRQTLLHGTCKVRKQAASAWSATLPVLGCAALC